MKHLLIFLCLWILWAGEQAPTGQSPNLWEYVKAYQLEGQCERQAAKGSAGIEVRLTEVSKPVAFRCLPLGIRPSQLVDRL